MSTFYRLRSAEGQIKAVISKKFGDRLLQQLVVSLTDLTNGSRAFEICENAAYATPHVHLYVLVGDTLELIDPEGTSGLNLAGTPVEKEVDVTDLGAEDEDDIEDEKVGC